eukprot:3735715-Pyramimonas_sp.AAC.1
MSRQVPGKVPAGPQQGPGKVPARSGQRCQNSWARPRGPPKRPNEAPKGWHAPRPQANSVPRWPT